MDQISIKRATTISAINKYSSVIMNLLLSAVLSRILSPEDYGIIAIITVFTTFFTSISDMGLGTAVIQNKNLTWKEVNDIYSFSVYVAVVISLVFVCSSIPISMIYKNSVYRPVCYILAFSVFFSTCNTIPTSLLNKEKEFSKLCTRTIIITAITGLIAVIIAICGGKYYALAFQSLGSSTLAFIWNIKGSGLKFLFKFDKKSINKVKVYSLYQFLFGLINYFSRNLDNLLIGTFIGGTTLANYDKSYKLMKYPIQNITHVITPVLHPILSEYQEDKEYIYIKYSKIVKVLSLIGVFVSVYCFFASKEIINILYGRQWDNAVTSFKLLSVSVWAQMVTSSVGIVFQSTNNTKMMFKCGLAATFVNCICITIGVFYKDINIVAFMVMIGLNLSFIINFYPVIVKIFRYNFGAFVAQFIPEILMVIAMSFAVIILPFKFENVLVSAIYKGLVCLAVYIIMASVTGQIQLLFALIRRSR